MSSKEIRQRSDFLGTQVVTCNTGTKLGIVSELWADSNRQVVGVSIRPSLLYGMSQSICLSSVRDLGDVILVEGQNAVEAIDARSYTNLINCKVVTETGALLGQVRDFRFSLDSGKVTSLILAALASLFIPAQLLSTYELPANEIISSTTDRITVFEGSEERLTQLSVGILERLGIGSPPWERDEQMDEWHLDDWDDETGGTAPSPRPKRPTPSPIINESAASPD